MGHIPTYTRRIIIYKRTTNIPKSWHVHGEWRMYECHLHHAMLCAIQADKTRPGKTDCLIGVKVWCSFCLQPALEFEIHPGCYRFVWAVSLHSKSQRMQGWRKIPKRLWQHLYNPIHLFEYAWILQWATGVDTQWFNFIASGEVWGMSVMLLGVRLRLPQFRCTCSEGPGYNATPGEPFAGRVAVTHLQSQRWSKEHPHSSWLNSCVFEAVSCKFQWV